MSNKNDTDSNLIKTLIRFLIRANKATGAVSEMHAGIIALISHDIQSRSIYGCETWTITTPVEKKLLTFKIDALKTIPGEHKLE